MKGSSFASEDRPAYRTVVFDLYGTLADIRTDEEDPAVWEAFSRKMADFGAVREAAAWKEEYALTCRRQERAMEEELQRAGIPGPPEIDLLSVWREMAAGCGVRLTADAAQSVSECFRKASMRRLRLYDGAAEVLAALRGRGIRLVLLTNAQESFTRRELKTLGIDGAFDELFLSSRESIFLGDYVERTFICVQGFFHAVQAHDLSDNLYLSLLHDYGVGLLNGFS